MPTSRANSCSRPNSSARRPITLAIAYLPNILPAARQTWRNLFTVPAELSLFPDQHVPCAFAGQERPMADMKWVRVAEGKNAAADFHVYTEVPKATRVVGFVLNDLTAEFNAQNPIFGEKGSPGWLPDLLPRLGRP